MLLTLPIMFIMLGALRSIAGEQMVAILETVKDTIERLGLTYEPGNDAANEAMRALLIAEEPIEKLLKDAGTQFLWIKNLWMPDSPFSSVLPTTASALSMMGGGDQIAALPAFIQSDIYQHIVVPAYNLTEMPGAAINLLVVNWQLYKLPNGFLVLPILSFVTQFFSNKYLTQQQQMQEGQKGAGAMMKWMMPVMFAFFCVSYTASFALYIVVSTVIHVAQTKVFNIWLGAQDQKGVALKEEVDKL
jgi:membrane protein insertase Oxa1/YidC/SpoIIIJ